MEETVGSLRGLHYHMVHNLRAPLRAIQGFSCELQETCGGVLGEEGHDLLQRINDSSVRMEELIRSYQDYITLNYLGFAWRTVKLERLVGAVASKMSAEFEARKPLIELQQPLPEFWTCPVLLEKILVQLFRNALTYVAPATTPSVKVWAQENETHVHVFVKDNGIGIAPEHHERIFWLFERLAAALEYPGIGMGLPIACKCADRLGGLIRVETGLGVGSCLVVELPKAPQKLPNLSISDGDIQSNPDAIRENKSMKPIGTILLAEDDENEFLLMKMAFGKVGVENIFRRVKDGEEVIRYLEATDPFSDRQQYPFPCLLLLDLKMPMMGGFEVLEWIRGQPRYQQLIVTILSASTNGDDVAHAYNSNANSYLVKPDTFSALVEMVSKIKSYWLDLNTNSQFTEAETNI
jgi:CheY-like chemotaxis protein